MLKPWFPVMLIPLPSQQPNVIGVSQRRAACAAAGGHFGTPKTIPDPPLASSQDHLNGMLGKMLGVNTSTCGTPSTISNNIIWIPQLPMS